MDFSQFLSEVCRRSDSQLTAMERCYTHWQIWHNGKCLIDVWPTTNKYREANLGPGSPARPGDPYTAINRAIELIVLVKKNTAEPSGTCKVTLSSSYLNELKSKVEHGYNLLNEEARHLFAHAGILIPKHERCQRCNNDGTVVVKTDQSGVAIREACPVCRGRKAPKPATEQAVQSELSWVYDFEGTWSAKSAHKDSQGNDRKWIINATSFGSFWIGDSDFLFDDPDACEFPTLQQAKDWCQKKEHADCSRDDTNQTSPSKESLLASAAELLRSVTTSAMDGIPANCIPCLRPGSYQRRDTERSLWHTWDRLVSQLLKEIDDVI